MANDLKYHSIYSVERIRQQHFTHSILKFYKNSSPMFSVEVESVSNQKSYPVRFVIPNTLVVT